MSRTRFPSLALAAAFVCGSLAGGNAFAAVNPNSATLTVRCGVMDSVKLDNRYKCKGLDIDHSKTDGQYIDGRVELYSGGTLVATENNPQVYNKPDGDTGSVDIVVDGNGDAATFKAWYLDPATSVLNASDITIKVWSNHGKIPTLVVFQNYNPVTSALWAQHSSDSAGLQAGVDAEAARAKAAEAGLQVSINNEAAARAAADNQLGADLAAEIAARKAGDAALQMGLDTEVQRAMAAEGAETQRAQNAEAQLQTNLDNETARAKAAEAGLQGALNQEVADRKAGDIAGMAYTDAETARAKTAEAALQTALNNEIARATKAEAVLTAGLNQEISDRKAAVVAAQAAANAYTDAETARAKAAETALQTALTNETTARTNADTTLQANITAEATTRANADTTLQTNINNEAAARTAADNAILAKTITINAGNGLAGGGAVALGGAVTLTNAGVTSLTSGGGITVNANVGAITLGSTLAGDVTGSGNANSVVRLQNRPMSNAAPAVNNVLTWDGNQWIGKAGGGGGGNLPVCPAKQMLVSAGGGNYDCGLVCGGVATDITNDVNNCGACGTVCALTANAASASCAASACKVASCNANFFDCNGTYGDGCECGNLPNATASCNGAACIPSCNAGFGNCDGNNGNGCEVQFSCDANNCGACGKVCAQGQSCTNGACVNGGGAVTKTYTLTTAAFVNLPNSCGADNFYNPCSATPFGFQWTDTGSGAATKITIQFQPGLTCNNGGARTPQLNAVNTTAFNFPNTGCTCTPAATGLITLDLTAQAASYKVGAANQFLIPSPSSCEGVYALAAGSPNYAIVTVTTSGGGGGGCGGGGGGACNAQGSAAAKAAAMSACQKTFANCVDDGSGSVIGYINGSCQGCNCDPQGNWAAYCYITGADTWNCSTCTNGQIQRSHNPCTCGNNTAQIGTYCQ